MNKYREQLQGAVRLPRIRRIKRLLLVLLVLLALGLSVASLLSQGAGLKPFYFPLDYVLPLILILVLIATFANFAFRLLEMRYSKRDAQRFLIAKHSMQRALLVLMVCVIVGTVLALPATGDAARDQLRVIRTGTVPSGGSVTTNFTSRDALALSQFVDIVVQVTVGPELAVEISTNPSTVPVTGTADGVDFSSPVDGDHFLEYSVKLENFNLRPVGFTLTLERVLSPGLTGAVPAVLFAFVASNAFWFAYLRPIRDRHKAASIYDVRHAPEVETGERTYADYSRWSGPAMPTPPTVGDQGTRGWASDSEPSAVEYEEPEPGPPSAEDAAGLIAQGSRLFENGDLESALARFDAALELEPENVGALLAGAEILLRFQRREEASGSFRRVLEIEERNAQALVGLAEVLEADGRWADAAATWARYEAVVPGEPEVRLRHADALLKGRDRAGAVRVLEEARRGFPDEGRIRLRFEEIHVDVPGLLSKALVASASGRFDEAIALLDRVLLQEPDHVNALVSRGIALRRASRLDEALASLDAALQRQPTNTAALRAKGQLLDARGAFRDALQVYEALHEASPHDPEVFGLEAAVLEKLGENEAALAAFQQAIQLNPANEEYRGRAEALVNSRGAQERFIEELFTIKGMGPARVRALLEAGYRAPDAIQKATEDDLAKVSGMTRSVAKELLRHFVPGPPPS